MSARQTTTLVALGIVWTLLRVPSHGQMPTGTIHGRVADESGKGIHGVKVQVCDIFAGTRELPVRLLSTTGTPPDCLTDRQGAFSLPVALGILCDVWFMKDGYATAVVRNAVPRSARLDAVLRRGVPLTGRVARTGGDRAAPAPVQLSLEPKAAMWVPCVQSRSVESDGSFQFRVVPPPEGMRWVVSFAGRAVPVDVRDGETPPAVHFALDGGGVRGETQAGKSGTVGEEDAGTLGRDRALRVCFAVAGICGIASLMLLTHLWVKAGGSAVKRVLWSFVVCVPVVGWVFYGGFYEPPSESAIKAQGKASGWMPHWPKHM